MADDVEGLEEARHRQEQDLIELITADIRRAWLPNTLIWLGVVGGSLMVVVGILSLVTGA